jgi:hypothetical protein
MYRFWIREIMGWLLVIVGVYVLLVALAILLSKPPPSGVSQPGLLEAPAIVVIGVVVFRGGIHLLKVAVAARVCMTAQAEAKKEPRAEKAKPTSAPPWDW